MQASKSFSFLALLIVIVLFSSSCSRKGLSLSANKQIQTTAELPRQATVTESRQEPIAELPKKINTDNHTTKKQLAIANDPYSAPGNNPSQNKSINIQAQNSVNTHVLKSGKSIRRMPSPVRLTHETKVLGSIGQCILFIILLAAIAIALAVLSGAIELAWLPLTTFNTYLLVGIILVLVLVAVVKLFDLLVG